MFDNFRNFISPGANGKSDKVRLSVYFTVDDIREMIAQDGYVFDKFSLTYENG